MTSLVIDFGTIKQGSRPTVTFTWPLPSGHAPTDFSGAALTGTMLNINTNDVTSITGTLTVTDGTARTITWEMTAADTGTDGPYGVTLKAVIAGLPVYTLFGRLVIEDNPSVNAVSNPALVGVSTDEAAWLTAAETAGDSATDDNLMSWSGGVPADSGYAPIDEDNMASDSASKLPTQQSVKAYVDGGIDDLSGVTDAATARTNLGLGTIATQDADSVAVTGGSVTGITDITVADGGTGASDAANARANLGVPLSAASQAADFTTTELPASGDFGVQTTNYEMQMNAQGYIVAQSLQSIHERNALNLSPLAYWPLRETLGTNARNRIQSPERDGTYGGTVTVANNVSADGFPCPTFTAGHVDVYDVDGTFGWADKLATPTEFSVIVTFRIDAAGTWADSTRRDIVNLTRNSSNYIRISKSTSANIVTVNYGAGGTLKAVSLTLGKTTWYRVGMSVSVTGDALKAFVNGAQSGSTQTSLGVWAGTYAATTTCIGATDTSNTNPWKGEIADVQIYNRALTDAEMQSLTALPSFTLYVDSANGNDGNTGRTQDDAFATIGAAHTAAAVLGNTTVKVVAPAASPFRESLTQDEKIAFTLEPLIAGTDWYWYGSTQYTSGWTSAGGGMYTRADPGADQVVIVTDLPDATWGNLQTLLRENTSTPTSLSAGEFGTSAGTLYVRLPGDVDPNSYTIEVPTNTYVCDVTDANATLTVKNGILQYAQTAVCHITTGTLVISTNGEIRYATNGVQAGGGTVDLDDLTIQRVDADGVNVNGSATVTIDNVTGQYCRDEAISNHNTSTMTATSCTLTYNGSGGATCGGGTMNLDTCTCSNNFIFLQGGETGDEGGITYKAGTTGTCQDCTANNNDGYGFACDATATPTLTNLTATGNTLGNQRNDCGA